MEKISLNYLLEFSSPIFTLSTVFRNRSAEETLEYNQFRDQVVSAFDTLERKAFEKQIDVASLQHVKYALAAYFDEIVMSSDWEERHSWMSKPLQLEFFGEHLAGEGFFTRLKELRQAGKYNVDILEVYYICLQLGFEGVYRVQGLEKLMALQVDLKSQIDSSRGGVDPRLSPDAIPQLDLVEEVSREVPFWVIGSVTFAILFFIYLGYSIAIDHQANKSLVAIKKEIKSLTHHQLDNEFRRILG